MAVRCKLAGVGGLGPGHLLGHPHGRTRLPDSRRWAGVASRSAWRLGARNWRRDSHHQYGTHGHTGPTAAARGSRTRRFRVRQLIDRAEGG